VSLSVLSAPQPSAALLASTAAVQKDEAPPKALNQVIIVLGLVVFAGLVAALI
jgi:hypothetical protein